MAPNLAIGGDNTHTPGTVQVFKSSGGDVRVTRLVLRTSFVELMDPQHQEGGVEGKGAVNNPRHPKVTKTHDDATVDIGRKAAATQHPTYRIPNNPTNLVQCSTRVQTVHQSAAPDFFGSKKSNVGIAYVRRTLPAKLSPRLAVYSDAEAPLRCGSVWACLRMRKG